MKAFKKRLVSFVKNESGMEFIQVAVIVLAVALLAAFIYRFYTKIGQQIENTPLTWESGSGAGAGAAAGAPAGGSGD